MNNHVDSSLQHAAPDKESLVQKFAKSSLYKTLKRDKYFYILFAPVLLYYLIFRYAPMFGLVIAFKDYNLFKGIAESPWVGFKYFKQFFESVYFFRIVRNTLLVNLYAIVFGFPMPIILALLLNDMQNQKFKRITQTISYLPHFISTVVVVSLVVNFLSPGTGVINNIIEMLGGKRIHFLAKPEYFRTIYTSMNIWKEVGWGSIIYLASISGIDPQLYEAAIIDGAGRWRQLWHVTLPGIRTTIIILLILRIGRLLEVGFESIILMYNSQIYETADVLSTYVYRRGLIDADYSFATAVGLFQSVIGLLMVYSANMVVRKLSEENSLW